MSKIYIGTHKEWGIQRTENSPEAVAKELGCDVGDLIIEEMEKTDYLLIQVPPEFRSCLSYMAYERGHHAGQDETELILEGLVSDLKPAIEAFEKRLRNEIHSPTQR